MKTYRTRNQGCAAALRYALGSEAHLKTYREQRGTTFLFDDSNEECGAIAKQFFNDHGEGPFPVTDAKVLIDSFVEIRKTMTVAINSPDGQWSNGEMQNEWKTAIKF